LRKRPAQGTCSGLLQDPDDSTVTIVNCGVNHFPRIDSISVKGIKVNNGDTVRVGIGSAVPIIIHAFDSDIGYGDSLNFLFRRGSIVPDTILKDSVYAYVPQRSDTWSGFTFPIWRVKPTRRGFI